MTGWWFRTALWLGNAKQHSLLFSHCEWALTDVAARCQFLSSRSAARLNFVCGNYFIFATWRDNCCSKSARISIAFLCSACEKENPVYLRFTNERLSRCLTTKQLTIHWWDGWASDDQHHNRTMMKWKSRSGPVESCWMCISNVPTKSRRFVRVSGGQTQRLAWIIHCLEGITGCLVCGWIIYSALFMSVPLVSSVLSMTLLPSTPVNSATVTSPLPFYAHL